MISVCTISTEGAPSLRFLQEPALNLPKGWAVILPPRCDRLRGVIKTSAQASPIPALRQEGEERSTHCVADACESKAWAGCRYLRG